MAPGAAVVTGPGGGIALRAGIARTSEHKGPLASL